MSNYLTSAALKSRRFQQLIFILRGGILSLFLLLTFYPAKSTTFSTIENGNWSDTSVWLAGMVPAFAFSDTILIQDTVYFDTDIYLNSGAFMQIDSLGGAMCGHHNITVYSGAVFNKYGALCLDSLFIRGGTAEFILPGPFLMFLTEISAGSFHVSSYVQSCMCAWDTCFIRIPIVFPPIDPVIITEYTVFPNPSNGNFNLEYSQGNESTFYFYNLLGQLLFSSTLEGTSGYKNFNNFSWENGIYYWEVRSGNELYQKGKHLILK